MLTEKCSPYLLCSSFSKLTVQSLTDKDWVILFNVLWEQRIFVVWYVLEGASSGESLDFYSSTLLTNKKKIYGEGEDWEKQGKEKKIPKLVVFFLLQPGS